jgi:hypothetical protein
MTTMVWGEEVQVILGIGVPVDVLTLNVSTLDGPDVFGGKLEADVTQYCQSVSINRGRSDNLAQFQSGSCSLNLNNPNRIFDPINTSSPYYDAEARTSGITPKRSIQILSEGEALFTGKIQDIDITYDLGGTSFVSIIGTDAFADLAAATIEQAFTPDVEKSGARLEMLLALPEVDLPNAQSIDAGTQDLGAYEVAVGTNALAYAQQIAEAEFGYFFIQGDGTIRFTERITAVFPEGVEAEFSDTGSDLPYSTLGITYGSEQLYNKVVCSIPEGAAQIANNLASQETFGIFSLDLTDLILENNDQALELAVLLATDYSLPVYRFDNISLKYNGLSEANREILSRIELADFIQITRNFPTGSPSEITQIVRCEAIRHSITANQHQLDLRLSPALLVYPLLLDDAVFGLLDSTNALS